MFEFAWPYIFLLLPLPWLLDLILPKNQRSQAAALRVPVMEDFGASQHRFLAKNKPLSFFLKCVIWLALVFAAARPQWIGDPIQIPQTGRDLMLAVDLSGSMQHTDFEVNGKTVDRLTAIKLILGDFIERRKGDRLGLILFGSEAYLQTPLTFDTTTVKQLLMESAIGLAGNGTAIGDAMGIAIKQLRDSPQESRVLILLTDGRNNTGELTPEKAADLAANAKLKIHTLAIGARESVVQTIFGAQRIDPSADIDEETLKLIAEKTGGEYFRAYDTKDLVRIYRHLDQLEAIDQDSNYYRPIDEVYYFPLLLAFTLMAGLMFEKVRR